MIRRRVLLAASEASGGDSIFPATIYPDSGENIINYNIAKYFIDTYVNMVVGKWGSNYTPITEDVTIEGSRSCDGKVLGVKKFDSDPEYESVLFYTQNSINNLHAFRVITNTIDVPKGYTIEWMYD